MIGGMSDSSQETQFRTSSWITEDQPGPNLISFYTRVSNSIKTRSHLPHLFYLQIL